MLELAWIQKGCDSMVTKTALMDIKKSLDGLVGEKVRVRANKGRKRVVEREGVLEKTYPHIFVVMLNEKRNSPRRVSFSYADVLTETVELTLCEQEEEAKIERAAR